jgi:hypothetical protein
VFFAHQNRVAQPVADFRESLADAVFIAGRLVEPEWAVVGLVARRGAVVGGVVGADSGNIAKIRAAVGRKEADLPPRGTHEDLDWNVHCSRGLKLRAVDVVDRDVDVCGRVFAARRVHGKGAGTVRNRRSEHIEQVLLLDVRHDERGP